MDYFDKLLKMAEARRNGEFQQLLAIYDSVPEKYKREKSIYMMRIQATQGLGDEALYAKALEDFRKDFPKDSAINLLSIDYFILRKKPDDAMTCIEMLDQAVEGDPYLNVARAGVNLEKGDLQTALKYVWSAIAADPNMLEGYWTLVTVSLRQKDYDTVLKTIRQLRDEHGLEFGDLTTVEDYKDFVKSTQYQQFLKDKPAANKSDSPRPRGQ